MERESLLFATGRLDERPNGNNSRAGCRLFWRCPLQAPGACNGRRLAVASIERRNGCRPCWSRVPPPDENGIYIYSRYPVIWHPCALCSPPCVSRKVFFDDGYFLSFPGSGQWDAFFPHDRLSGASSAIAILPVIWQGAIY